MEAKVPVSDLLVFSSSQPCMMPSRSRRAKKAKVVESTINPNWLELPRDVTANILQRLSAFTILMRARKVCSMWWNICKDPFMWRTIDMGMDDIDIFLLPQCPQSYDILRKMCSYAVDLSRGQLEDIRIYRFGNDDLLSYIADRAPHLRCIEIDGCLGMSDKGMCEVAKKLPIVEEFHVKFGYFSEDTLEVIGQSCPHLKSFKYTGLSWQTIVAQDEEAFAIAKTMPGLCHLDINGNPLSDVGLTAILDGCPLLESLDIQKCHNLDFSGNLWKRCHDQIKDVHYFDDYSGYSDLDTDNEYKDYDHDFVGGFDFGTDNEYEDCDYVSDFLGLQ